MESVWVRLHILGNRPNPETAFPEGLHKPNAACLSFSPVWHEKPVRLYSFYDMGAGYPTTRPNLSAQHLQNKIGIEGQLCHLASRQGDIEGPRFPFEWGVHEGTFFGGRCSNVYLPPGKVGRPRTSHSPKRNRPIPGWWMHDIHLTLADQRGSKALSLPKKCPRNYKLQNEALWNLLIL